MSGVRFPRVLGAHPTVWLVLGVFVTALSGMRYNVGLVGWVSLVPWLIYLRTTAGWRSRVYFLLALFVGLFLSVAKIITEPLSWSFALFVALPATVSTGLLYLCFEALRRRVGDRLGMALLPAIAVLGEFLSESSPLGSWGSLAYTQLENLALMQLASVTGLAGITALLSAASSVLAVALCRPHDALWRKPALSLFALTFLVHLYGAHRLFARIEGPTLKVATIVSDAKIDLGHVPTKTEWNTALFELLELTQQAATGGARLIVWNEGALVVPRHLEGELSRRLQAVSNARGVDIVAAFVVPLSSQARFENKYVWMTPEGAIETYHKHHPVPGEGALAGSEPLRVHHRPYGRAAGAICYDYDFPSFSRKHAELGADLVVVPASDWQGIDPFHAQMAGVRGIEGGFSVVRSTRFASSAAFDAHGVARGIARDHEGQRVLVSAVPVRRISTWGSKLSCLLPLVSVLILVGALSRSWRRPGPMARDITKRGPPHRTG